MTNGYRFNYTNESSLRNPNNIPKGGKNKFNTQFINYSQLIIIFYTLNFVNVYILINSRENTFVKCIIKIFLLYI